MLDFPNAPAVNQVFIAGSAAWKWDGVKWQANTTVSITGASIISVTGSITLPGGSPIVVVNVSNISGAPITLTLPTATLPDQTYKIKDVAGNGGTYAITIQPGAGTNIDGMTNYRLVSDFSGIEVYWTGYASSWGTR